MNRSIFSRGGDTLGKVAKFTAHFWVRQPWTVALALGCVMVTTLADVFTPLYVGKLVDALGRFVTDAEVAHGEALWYFGLLMALGAVLVVGRRTLFATIVTFTLRMMPQMAQEAFFHIQRLSTDWHTNSFSGSTVRKITRAMWALDALNDTIIMGLFPRLVMLVGASALLGWHWPVMGLVVAIGSLIYVALVIGLSVGYVSPAAQLANSWDTKVGGALADAITCNAVVKSFAGERREEARIDWVLGKWRRRTRRLWMRGTNSGLVQDTAMLIFRGAILGTALILGWSGGVTAGDLVFVLTLFLVLQGYLQEVGMHVRNLQRAVNEMEELVDIHAEPHAIADIPDASPLVVNTGEIVFDKVQFHYQGHATPLYQDFSLRIAGGERVGLVGHSGSGKTTFVKLIQRLHDVTGGAVLIDGQNVAEVTQESLRRQISIVPQEPVLFHRTLGENIAYGRPGARMHEIVAAARLANAHEFILNLPKGYDTLVGERGIKLSGGERQRVALARAFLADAPILILDEATSSLDSGSEQLIQEAIERLIAGRTTLVIAHRLSTVKSMDRLLVFERGEVVEEGRHEDLVGLSGGIYRSLYEKQAMELRPVAAE